MTYFKDENLPILLCTSAQLFLRSCILGPSMKMVFWNFLWNFIVLHLVLLIKINEFLQSKKQTQRIFQYLVNPTPSLVLKTCYTVFESMKCPDFKDGSFKLLEISFSLMPARQHSQFGLIFGFGRISRRLDDDSNSRGHILVK